MRVDVPSVSTVASGSICFLLIGALLTASPAWTDQSGGSPEDTSLESPTARMSATAPGADSLSGEALVPSNQDGFETGDFRNFSPRYIGDDDRWVRPSVSVSRQSPIEGDYSLRWSSDSTTQHWVHVSNAFYLRAPMEVSTTVRLEKAEGSFGVGLALLEAKDRSATLRLRPGGAGLSTGPPSRAGGSASSFTPEPGTPYRLTLKMGDDGRLTGTVARARDGRVVSELSSTAGLAPGALGLYVYLPAGTSTRAVFDQVEVQAAPYRIEAGKWIRSPDFVVLPRRPDVGLDQGNWVGAPSVVREGGWLRMWYRIRSNQSRGVGYGHAASQNGVHWKKSEQNPLFKHDPSYRSNEKMSVLKVEGVYRAWYTVDDGEKWVIAHATSSDGLQWEKRGRVISQTYAKDPVVVHVDDTYYLYAISPTRTDLGVYTSQDGRDWALRNVIPMQVHRHPGAYYAEETSTFWLYAFGGGRGVSRAASGDGIHFSPLNRVWGPSEVGLDDWSSFGIDYGSFLTDPQGHVGSDKNLYMYYQARNAYGNNIPGWRYHGGERTVLAARFHGLQEGIPATIRPSGRVQYHAFAVPGGSPVPLAVKPDGPVDVRIDRWSPTSDTLTAGSLTPLDSTEIRVELLVPDASSTRYTLLLGGRTVDQKAPMPGSTVLLESRLSGSEQQDFHIVLKEEGN